MKLLSRSEELLLLSIWRLKDNAYGVTIKHQMESVTDKSWSFGALHVTLDRLERYGKVRSRFSNPEQKRGGRSKRLYTLTPEGIQDLVEIKQIEKKMWNGIDDLSFGESS